MGKRFTENAKTFDEDNGAKPILHFVKWDMLVLGLVGILAFTTFLSAYLYHNQMKANTGELFAVVTVDGEEVLRVSLSQSTEQKLYSPIEGNPDFVVCIENGQACIKESNCKDQICVAAGFLSEPGDMAVCIPNRAVLKIVSEETSSDKKSYDVISQ